MAADLLWAGGFAAHTIVQKLRGKPRTDPPWLLCDFIRYNLVSWSRRLPQR
jgi:hypothetical protein